MKRGLRLIPFVVAFGLLTTETQGFERTVTFAAAEELAVITRRIRETIEDE